MYWFAPACNSSVRDKELILIPRYRDIYMHIEFQINEHKVISKYTQNHIIT